MGRFFGFGPCDFYRGVFIISCISPVEYSPRSVALDKRGGDFSSNAKGLVQSAEKVWFGRVLDLFLSMPRSTTRQYNEGVERRRKERSRTERR